ncbi:MAG: DNA mismatch repair protein MutL, partial [Oscillospiraceae bacterium]
SGISYKTNSEAQSVLTEAETILPKAENDFRLIGEAMNTYILVERDNALLLIDKHAAHERMIFDRIKAQGREIMSQALLLPVTLKLTAGEIELLEQNSESLIRLGFEIDLFGEDSVILRGVPADTDAAEAPAMVEEICEKLKKGVSLSEDGAADEILHTVACKAAIKAGRRSNEAELSELVRAVVSGEVKYCPHGRPVSVTLTKKQLDKEFSRIV